MKKLLVVSDPLAPPGFSPRVRFLCDYFVQKGYEVTLLTEEDKPLTFSHTYPIQTICMYSGTTLDWLVKTVWTLVSDWHNRVFAQRALSVLPNDYDAVLCTVFSDFPLGAGLRIARKLHIPLICDIRDIEEQVDHSFYQYHHKSRWLMPFRHIYRLIHRHRRNNVLLAANAITTVSPWHADFIGSITRHRSPITVIYNGYDARQFYPQELRTEQFIVSYIGTLHDWQKPALEQVKQAIEELQNPDIVLDIHTPQQNPVSHDKMGDAVRRSSIVLVLTAPHTHGMLTTKFYEALGCEKPILCVPSDKGCLADLITYTHAGIATDDKEAIKAFIMDQYKVWKSNGSTHQETQHREEFSRDFQTQQFEQLIQWL